MASLIDKYSIQHTPTYKSPTQLASQQTCTSSYPNSIFNTGVGRDLNLGKTMANGQSIQRVDLSHGTSNYFLNNPINPSLGY